MPALGEPRVVRSYQRIFKPDRRIYSVDGKTLPIPGGVPLRWLGWALTSLFAGLVLAAGSHLVILLVAGTAGVVAARAGRRRLAPGVAAGTVLAFLAVGGMLRSVDWPLRLIVMPAVAATAMTQLTPDGRPVHRFVTGWVRTRLRGWRSTSRPIAGLGDERSVPVRILVASDEHAPDLRAAQIGGPATVRFAMPLQLRRRRRRLVVRPLASRRAWGLVVDQVRVDEGERMEVQR